MLHSARIAALTDSVVLFPAARRAWTQVGGLYHERVDAQSYADWGAEYLKYDNCGEARRMPSDVLSRIHQLFS